MYKAQESRMHGENLLRWVDIQRKGIKKYKKPEEYGGTAVQRKKGNVKSKNKNENTLQGLLIDSGDTRLKSPVATHILGFSKEASPTIRCSLQKHSLVHEKTESDSYLQRPVLVSTYWALQKGVTYESEIDPRLLLV